VLFAQNNDELGRVLKTSWMQKDISNNKNNNKVSDSEILLSFLI
jgi:hypothetical protein